MHADFLDSNNKNLKDYAVSGGKKRAKKSSNVVFIIILKVFVINNCKFSYLTQYYYNLGLLSVIYANAFACNKIIKKTFMG